MKTKIYVPNRAPYRFSSLEEAVVTLKKQRSGFKYYDLIDTVEYNVCYRDHLRQHGLDSLIERLLREAPDLNADQKALDELRIWWEKAGKLADYDIQCYGINDTVTILGRKFKGLKDISSHRCIAGYCNGRGVDCYVPKDANTYKDVDIGELYESYPTFDIYDSCDGRTYQNYIFRRSPVTSDNMTEADKMIASGCNFCMVHEEIPVELLPILYYRGDGDTMLLATPKRKKNWLHWLY